MPSEKKKKKKKKKRYSIRRRHETYCGQIKIFTASQIKFWGSHKKIRGNPLMMNYNFFITRKMAKKKFWFSICGLSVTNLISFTQRKQKSLILLYFQIISLNNSCVYASLPTDRRHTRPHFASIVILSARRLLHRLMTYLFRANGGKHEGWIAKKSAPPFAHASRLPPFTWKTKK